MATGRAQGLVGLLGGSGTNPVPRPPDRAHPVQRPGAGAAEPERPRLPADQPAVRPDADRRAGGTPDITLAQAEATINTVVANRTSLAASARTLNAPTPLAASVRDALVASYDDSLTNDQDINNCLNQANNGVFAIIFQGCLSSTAADSNASTAAKQHFFTLYNQLRQQIGQPATNQSF